MTAFASLVHPKRIPADYSRCRGETPNGPCERRQLCARHTDIPAQPCNWVDWGCAHHDYFIENARDELK